MTSLITALESAPARQRRGMQRILEEQAIAVFGRRRWAAIKARQET